MDAVRLGSKYDDNETRAFHKFMCMIQKKISAAIALNCRDILWTVPTLDLDSPMYDRLEMMTRIKKRLRENKFYVRSVKTNETVSLYVSWRYTPHEN